MQTTDTKQDIPKFTDAERNKFIDGLMEEKKQARDFPYPGPFGGHHHHWGHWRHHHGHPAWSQEAGFGNERDHFGYGPRMHRGCPGHHWRESFGRNFQGKFSNVDNHEVLDINGTKVEIRERSVSRERGPDQKISTTSTTILCDKPISIQDLQTNIEQSSKSKAPLITQFIEDTSNLENKPT